MSRQLRLPASRTLRTAALILATAALAGPASAQGRKDADEREFEQQALAGPPMMAIVSVKHQRISLYDAYGNAVRARTSSGKTGYETPAGTYSILQKNKEHYSNVYDDAAMPFMQRLTWSGIALHQGDLPGYPASHGCVRMPWHYAEHIFPMTRIGMRVIVARDNVAPVEIAHPTLFKATALDQAVVATKASFEDDDYDREALNVFEADVRRWPGRQTQMEALKAVTDLKAAEAEARKSDVERWQGEIDGMTPPHAALTKALRSAERVKKLAGDKAQEAAKSLERAKDPAKLKPFEADKTKADAAVVTAQARLDKAKAAVTVATSDKQRRKLEREVRALEKAKRAAEARAGKADRALKAAQSPTRFKKQEDALAKLQATAQTAAAKHSDARAAFEASDKELTRFKDELAKATEALSAAQAAAKDAKLKTFPVSMFVSLKSQRLYVRQGHEPVAEYPITVPEPDRPIGTHVFTAVAYDDTAQDLRWTAVTLNRRSGRELAEVRSKSKNDAGAPYPTDVSVAAAALDRVTIPQEVLDRFAKSMWPGSSLIVSDEPLHKETNNATDFIVLLSDEPQGGIKKRPKPKPQPAFVYFDDGYGRNYYRPARGYGQYARPVRPLRQPIRVKPQNNFFNFW